MALHETPESDRRPRESKPVWILGALLLVLILFLGAWGFHYASNDPDYGKGDATTGATGT